MNCLFVQIYETTVAGLSDADREAAGANYHLLTSRLVDANRSYQATQRTVSQEKAQEDHAYMQTEIGKGPAVEKDHRPSVSADRRRLS